MYAIRSYYGSGRLIARCHAIALGAREALDQPCVHLGVLPLAPLRERGAGHVVVVQHLAVQAMDAFVGIDMPVRMDGLDRTASYNFV